MSEGVMTPDLRGLEDRYEIVGELRGSPAGRTYIGRPNDGSAEVAITVVQRPKGGESNELSHYAADTQILENVSHPSLARVLDGHWIGNDAYAIVTERIQGETLAERLDRGERFGNPGIALLLQDVSRVLDWARDKGIVHRLVTPDTVFFEHETNRVRMSFAPSAIPITGVPGACGDMRTLGMLAWAMFTGEQYDETAAPKSLGEANPNLATRVVDATDKAIRCNEGGELSEVATFLGIVASGDVLKQAEVEIAAMKEEYDEEHRRELQKCEMQRQEVEDHAAEQAAILAGEREEFAKHMEEERAALAAERAEFERVMAERKDRLGTVRGELDQQRVEMEQRLAELEAYRAEVEKARDAAIAAAEKARQDAIEAADKWRKEALAASAAAAAAATAAAEAAMKDAAANAAAASATAGSATAPAPTESGAVADAAATALTAKGSTGKPDGRGKASTPKSSMPKPAAPVLPPPPPPVAVPKVAMPTPPKALKEMKAPKWDKKMQRLDATDEELIAATAGRPGWMIPAGVATLAIIIIAVVYSLMHRGPANDAVRIGNSTVVPTTTNTAAGIIPRGGFLTQPPAGAANASGGRAATSPLVGDTTTGTSRVDSAGGVVAPGSSPSAAPGDSAPARAKAAGSTPSASTTSTNPPSNSGTATSGAHEAVRTARASTDRAAPEPRATAPAPDSAPGAAPSTAAAPHIDSSASAARSRLDSAAATLLPRRDTARPAATPQPPRPDTTGRSAPPASPVTPPPAPPDTLSLRR